MDFGLGFSVSVESAFLVFLVSKPDEAYEATLLELILQQGISRNQVRFWIGVWVAGNVEGMQFMG